ncbi:acyltransferase [Klebsiella pneumoniae]|nr:acyltransferase [Klebsiella pneumoniae]
MKKEIIDSLTGIRGIAAIYVVIYHLFHHASDNNFINNGYLSVDLFFILSGFIITHAHRNDFFDVVTKKNYITFMLSRVMRIWPAGNDSNLLIVFYVQIVPDDFVMQLHRF